MIPLGEKEKKKKKKNMKNRYIFAIIIVAVISAFGYLIYSSQGDQLDKLVLVGYGWVLLAFLVVAFSWFNDKDYGSDVEP